MSMNRIQFQLGLSLPKFLKQFGTETQCAAELEQARWPQGFVCPCCAHTGHSVFKVHMVRNSLRFVSWKDRKLIAADLKRIYQSITVEEAEMELKSFAKTWDGQYPSISQSWRNHWPNLIAFFDYPNEIRKVIYTTNAIESLNSVIRKATNARKIFPNDQSAMKVVYLAIENASKKWSMPLRDWKPAINQFMIMYQDRMPNFN